MGLDVRKGKCGRSSATLGTLRGKPPSSAHLGEEQRPLKASSEAVTRSAHSPTPQQIREQCWPVTHQRQALCSVVCPEVCPAVCGPGPFPWLGLGPLQVLPPCTWNNPHSCGVLGPTSGLGV